MIHSISPCISVFDALCYVNTIMIRGFNCNNRINSNQILKGLSWQSCLLKLLVITICVHCMRSHCIDKKRNMSHSIVFPNRDDLDQSWTGGDKQQHDALRSCAMCQYYQPGNINLFIWSNRSSNRYCFPSVK